MCFQGRIRMGLWEMGKRTDLGVEYAEKDDLLGRIVDKIFTVTAGLCCVFSGLCQGGISIKLKKRELPNRVLSFRT